MRERTPNREINGVGRCEWIGVCVGTRIEFIGPIQPPQEIKANLLELGDVQDDGSEGHCHGESVVGLAHMGDEKTGDLRGPGLDSDPNVLGNLIAKWLETADKFGIEYSDVTIDGGSGDEGTVFVLRGFPKVG